MRSFRTFFFSLRRTPLYVYVCSKSSVPKDAPSYSISFNLIPWLGSLTIQVGSSVGRIERRRFRNMNLVPEGGRRKRGRGGREARTQEDQFEETIVLLPLRRRRPPPPRRLLLGGVHYGTEGTNKLPFLSSSDFWDGLLLSLRFGGEGEGESSAKGRSSDQSGMEQQLGGGGKREGGGGGRRGLHGQNVTSFKGENVTEPQIQGREEDTVTFDLVFLD